MFFTRDLGATPTTVHINVVPITAAATASQGSGQVYATAIGYKPPTHVDSPHITWAQAQSIHVQMSSSIGQRDYIDAPAALIATGTLPPCPASSNPSGDWGGCYNSGRLGRPLFIPGTFEVLGVPFHVSEVQSSRVDKRFAATPDQRRMIEWQIISKSRDRLSGTPPGSIIEVMRDNPDMRYELPNFELNPIAPTYEELNGPDGYRKWIARGGYPIDVRLIQGADPILERISPDFCLSILCNCNGVPTCIRGNLGRDDSGTSNNWNVYVSLEQGEPYEFSMALIHNDAGWYEKAAAWMGAQLAKLASLLCADKGIAQQQIQAAVAEKCVDAKKAICKKGTNGCVCTTPPTSTQVAANLTNTAMQRWCAGWMAENTKPTWEPPTPNNPAPFPTGPIQVTKPFPWWTVVLGGMTVGAFLFSRK